MGWKSLFLAKTIVIFDGIYFFGTSAGFLTPEVPVARYAKSNRRYRWVQLTHPPPAFLIFAKDVVLAQMVRGQEILQAQL